ncbi:uncharacterized protein KY384_009023 [Bacidia gigantensis]|uniref:uncharacterized protein n=1 Tax=Bacidia gigantensis TaxID=2732470 RepID=UPI001D047DAE|nr:uncharacterized protein KY384_009023 [Bacidia gigantensis]KAG8525379.1 hypothetical protein KY384_009023 [Bacidia gigantensis]
MSSQLPAVRHPDHPKVRKDRVRLLIFLYRKEGMSFDDFDNYWRDEHTEVICKIPIFKRNLLKYEQIHLHKDEVESYKNGERPVAVADYDGIAVLDAVSAEKIREMFEDKEYQETAGEDEKNFIERTKAVIFPGEIVNIFDTPT